MTSHVPRRLSLALLAVLWGASTVLWGASAVAAQSRYVSRPIGRVGLGGGFDVAGGGGALVDVAGGVRWLRRPLPERERHVGELFGIELGYSHRSHALAGDAFAIGLLVGARALAPTRSWSVELAESLLLSDDAPSLRTAIRVGYEAVLWLETSYEISFESERRHTLGFQLGIDLVGFVFFVVESSHVGG